MADLPYLERLLRCPEESLHELIAHHLWDSETDREAVQSLEKLSKDNILRYEDMVAKKEGVTGTDVDGISQG